MMSIQDRISVIIITHNRYNYLKEAIGSVLRQSFVPHQVIVIDDGSLIPVSVRMEEDDSFPSDFPIELVRIPDLGPAAARNAGANIATGNIIAFLDDDDVWHDDYLYESLECLEESGASCTVSGLICFDGKRQWAGKRLPVDLSNLDIFSKNYGFVGSNFVMYKRVFELAGGFDVELLGSEDKDLLIRLQKERIKLSVLPVPMVYYRVHPSSQASGKNSFHSMQVYGKIAFYNKHKSEMSLITRFRLKAQSSYFMLRGGRTFKERLLAASFLCFTAPMVVCLVIKRY